MTNLVRLPKMFFIDHEERDLPTPVIQKQNERHVWVRIDDPDIPELLSDAEYYSDPLDPDIQGVFYSNLRRSAAATARSIKSQQK